MSKPRIPICPTCETASAYFDASGYLVITHQGRDAKHEQRISMQRLNDLWRKADGGEGFDRYAEKLKAKAAKA